MQPLPLNSTTQAHQVARRHRSSEAKVARGQEPQEKFTPTSQQDNPGLLPRPKGFWQSAADLVERADQATTKAVKWAMSPLEGLADKAMQSPKVKATVDVLSKLPQLHPTSDGNFEVKVSDHYSVRSDGTFSVSNGKTRFHSDGTASYDGYNSSGSWSTLR